MATNGTGDQVEIGGPNSANATDKEVAELEQTLKPVGDEDGEHGDEGGDEGDERTTKNDSEINDAKSEEEREAIRARRRVERRERKNKQHDRLDSATRLAESLAAQNKELAERLARLENNDAALKLSQLDDAITATGNDFNRFKQAHAAAVSKNDGATASQAMELMLQARDRQTQLTGLKESVVSAAKQQPALDPQAKNYAMEFAGKHKWYGGPKAQDPDSDIMTRLDAQVQRDGFDPRSTAYWQELESRGKKYLPHRFGANGGNSRENTSNGGDSGYTAGNGRETPRSPVGGAAERGNVSGDDGGFRLSSERVKAMKEAGAWEDPAARKRMIEKYRAYDKAQQSN